jgi:hypothetical protein
MTKLLLAFRYDARGWYRSDPAWKDAERMRRESGSTSIRVSKATVVALHDLRRRMLGTIPAAEKSLVPDQVTLDALLAALAEGDVKEHAPVVRSSRPRMRKSLQAKKHAGRSRSMQKKGSRKVQAKKGARRRKAA